ncbi:uncharacterized protein LOC111357680 isoform X1 [Spodoptera litura]|uniref:Uncharacterized protein LOC111357680 isoform X1 n=1 Tax=Spodoptera litura TaxID=69820 RepID=A0A9J7IX60_SPOLT|nr:uncharacterized protein LOC111357680 isoform X1 [Spodoptera litura]
MLEKNKTWLEGADLEFKVAFHRPQASTSAPLKLHPGRPPIDFENASEKTKKRRVEELVSERSASELTLAAEIAHRKAGFRNVAKAIRSSNSPAKGNQSTSESCVGGRQLSSDEALAYYIDSKCTTHSYKQTRKWSMKAGHRVFPSYYSLCKSKLSCYPLEEHISITESRADIRLQAILDLTTNRLVKVQNEVIRSVLSKSSSFTLVSKWGCDGSSGHSTYKQKFENVEATDEFLFVFSFVPLQLYDGDIIIWQNPRPSSTTYCRPIKFIFAKETKELTTTETQKVLDEVSQLLPTLCNVAGSQISVNHKFLLTMTDGKICNALTDTLSAQKCYICGATPLMMNDESKDFPPKEDNLSFGLSTLHAWIRSFECLLHISYRLDFKKWQARSKADKDHLKLRSEIIKDKFKKELGLIVDKPKPGYGNSNDGNTARRFFSNAALSAEITGLDVDLIKKLGILLTTLSSGYDIDLNKLAKYCSDIKTLYLSLYSWYYMPVTLHKILVHSTEVVKSSLLPIGQLSEEAQEARNKDCRRFREHHTRKRSRIATNTDLLHMLLLTSDPLINTLREIPVKRLNKLPAEVLDMIIPPSQPPLQVPSNLDHTDENYLIPDSSDSECESD